MFVFLLILMYLTFSPVDSQCLRKYDYYWREYKGVLPHDALPASYGGCDGTVYVAQGFFLNVGLLPAGLYQNSPEILVSAQFKLFTTNKHIKILCTPRPHLFRWLPSSTGTIENLKTRCELVYGGVESDNTMYIARKVQNGKLMVGRIYKYPDGTSFLVLPAKNPQNEIKHSEFEVLTYNCNESCEIGSLGDAVVF